MHAHARPRTPTHAHARPRMPTNTHACPLTHACLASPQEGLESYLSPEQRRVFGVSPWWVAFLLIAGTVGALALAALMLAHQMTALSLKARRDAARNDRERDELAAFRAREKARPHASSSCVTLPFPESSSRFPPRAKPALRADITTAACGTTQPFRPFLLRVAMSLTGARPTPLVRRPPSQANEKELLALRAQLGEAQVARRSSSHPHLLPLTTLRLSLHPLCSNTLTNTHTHTHSSAPTQVSDRPTP